MSVVARLVHGMDQYQLSCEILGHSADVRAVKCLQLERNTRQHVLTASRDGTACVWAPEHGSSEYLLRKVMRQHTGYVSALCVIPADESSGRHKRKSVSKNSSLILHVRVSRFLGNAHSRIEDIWPTACV